jgi:hypothetical protein
MLPLPIIVDFDVVEKRLLSPGNILEFAVMDELGLYCVEERFCHCIVPAVSLPTHTLHEPVLFQHCPEIPAGMLNASVTVNLNTLA